MSDYKPVLQVNFINRRKSDKIANLPLVNRISINTDLRQFSDTFDFDITYRFSDTVDLHSHDFVEFYFWVDNQKVQVFCGFIEDLHRETSAVSHNFQANGRDFLGQLFNLPFLEANPLKETTLVKFAEYCLQDGYLPEYMKLNNRTQYVMSAGAYANPVNVPQLTDAKRAPVIQSVSDQVFNLIYQDALGRAVVWGRDNLGENDTGLTLREYGDFNCKRMVLKEAYSRVFSEVRVLYTGAEQNLDYALQIGKKVVNTDQFARTIFQPEIRSFQNPTLITTAPSSPEFEAKVAEYAASLMRRSNQNLRSVIVVTNLPFHVDQEGNKTVYAKNQLWQIVSPSYNLNEKMRLAGVSYTQDAQALEVQLLFIGYDTLI